MERLFRFLANTLRPLLSAWGVYLVSVVLNQIGESSVVRGEETFWARMIDFTNASVFLLYVFTGIVLLAVLGYAILRPLAYKRESYKFLTDIMKEHTDASLKTDINGGLSWGLNKTVAKPDLMLLGWKADHIMVEKCDNVKYTFPNSSDDECGLQQKHAEFYSGEDFQSVERCGNNLTRYMLTRYKANVNKSDPRLVIDLRNTSWDQTSFIWYEAKKNRKWKDGVIRQQLSSRTNFLPNSFCLHLMIETSDGEVLITGISAAKENDYPTKKAVSIGEQIELSDFIQNPSEFSSNFVKVWVRRAIKEEFGLTDELFDAVFDIESIRVLGLDIEADIINYSLPCVIRMNKKCDEFKDIICNTIDTKEISYLDSLSLNEIPAVLLSWAPDKESNWHPSSYLRLLLFLIHHKGYKRTSQMLSKEQRKNKKHSKK